MYPVADLQYFASKSSFEPLSHIDLFEDPNEIVIMHSNLSHVSAAYVLPLMLGILIHQNDNRRSSEELIFQDRVTVNRSVCKTPQVKFRNAPILERLIENHLKIKKIREAVEAGRRGRITKFVKKLKSEPPTKEMELQLMREIAVEVFLNVVCIMEKANETLLPGVYKEFGKDLLTDPTGFSFVCASKSSKGTIIDFSYLISLHSDIIPLSNLCSSLEQVDSMVSELADVVANERCRDLLSSMTVLQSSQQFAYAPVAGKSSTGRPPHALVTFDFGGKLFVMKDHSSFGNPSFGSQVSHSDSVIFSYYGI
ncbi:hypothetical protein BC332_18320 [Capsicum chinense]|nr:hypothetical protein BC332_18320 [Capsicum chinense]